MWMGQVPEIVLFVTEFVINPNGKSEVCILHEYMQRVLKVRPVYNFFECGKFKPISVLEESHIVLLVAGGGSEYIGPAGLDRHARQGQREVWCR